jgi:hypothetical protein
MRAISAILMVALVTVGCSSSSALKPDGGAGQGGAAAGTSGGGAGGATAGASGGAAGAGGATAGAGGGAAGAGGATAGAGGATAGAGGGATGGAGGAVGYCDKDEDCVFHSACCGGVCIAKADPPVTPMVCNTSCAIGFGPATCGCVNHKCSSESACIVPGSGLCPYCANGYMTGATGCQTCTCVGGDAGSDAGVHAAGEACDDGLGCTSGLVCKAIGDPCPTYPKCNRCYMPCNGGACPFGLRCVPPVGQGGDVCL